MDLRWSHWCCDPSQGASLCSLVSSICGSRGGLSWGEVRESFLFADLIWFWFVLFCLGLCACLFACSGFVSFLPGFVQLFQLTVAWFELLYFVCLFACLFSLVWFCLATFFLIVAICFVFFTFFEARWGLFGFRIVLVYSVCRVIQVYFVFTLLWFQLTLV